MDSLRFQWCFDLPNLSKQVKVIKILKSGKDSSDASHFRTISRLSVVFKSLIDWSMPILISQASFHEHRSWTEQVLALTSPIEAGFQRKLKTGAVFIDLTAAYDNIWIDSLMLKFIHSVNWAKLAKLWNKMLSNRYSAYRVLDIKFADTPIPHFDNSSLTYVHLTQTAKKVATRL
jgi:Reverse transcriptase (RNA-dependent DNA polymerase)